MLPRLGIIAAFLAVLFAPFALRPDSTPPPADARRLIVITPHHEQIRAEFALAFDAWHRARHGEPVHVVWSVPGGTSEIRRMLESQYTAALRAGRSPGGAADLVFGGGSWEHERLKRGVRVTGSGATRDEPITAPVRFPAAWLDEVYGVNAIGDGRLYDPEGYWFGTALSSFGLVFNRDVLARLAVPEPATWADLADPRLAGWVALTNPGQSGSITTAFDAVLQRRGWGDGWRILRRAGANARSISASSLKAPADVGAGEAAVGVSIDFYGRYQAQAIRAAGGVGRVGFIDPPGMGGMDADPISMLRGAPDPELARRFIAFCLSEEAQALWQFPAGDAGGLGPRRHELRRLMIRRSMYRDHFDNAIDRVNPFELAAPSGGREPVFRSFIAVLFTAMVIDTRGDLEAAWRAITGHPSYPVPAPGTRTVLVAAADVADPSLRRLLERFDAMPTVAGPGGAVLPLETTRDLAAIRDGWLTGGWRSHGLWPPEAAPEDVLRRRWGAFFRAQYRRIVAEATADAEGR